MRAFVVTKFKAPLQEADVPEPVVGKHDVRVVVADLGRKMRPVVGKVVSFDQTAHAVQLLSQCGSRGNRHRHQPQLTHRHPRRACDETHTRRSHHEQP